MKKLFGAVLLGLLASGVAFSATAYQSLGNVSLSTSTVSGGLGLWTRTAAQILTLQPSTTGQIIVCTNCTVPYSLCVSTGSTANYQWILSTGTACK